MLVRREDFGPLACLKHSSHKKIWFICEYCGCGVLRQYNVYIKSEKRCLSCRSKDNNNKSREINRQSQIKRWQTVDRDKISTNISIGQKRAWANNPTRKSKQPTPFSHIIKDFNSVGYLVLTKESDYVNAKTTPIKFRCSRGHVYHIKYSKFIVGQRCGKCCGNMNLNYDSVYIDFKNMNLRLLSNSIENARTSLDYQCSICGYVGRINYDNLKKGHGCAQCAGNAKIEMHIDQLKLLLDDFSVLSDKTILHRNDGVTLICKNNHISNLTVDSILKGKRCRGCYSHYISLMESDVVKFITSLGIIVETNNKSLISPYEIDIWIPDKQIAIEFDGLYWHSESAGGKNKKYHLNKTEMCNKRGAKLIHIFEDEWVYKQDIVKSKLKHLFGRSQDKIYARNCIIKPIDTKSASDFCNKHHIQGYTASRIKLGAFYGDTLVSVMTFSKLSISKGAHSHEGHWELNRFCTSVSVIGVASKLLVYFKHNYEWSNIISYADRRWSSGGLYDKLGFIFQRNTSPGYWYIVGNKRAHRFKFRRNTLIGEGTEWQIMQSNGYDRIWDCGHILFKMTK